MIMQPMKAFVAGPRGYDLSPLESLLRSLDVLTDDPTSSMAGGVPAFQQVLSAIRGSDIAILVYGESDTLLGYEIGVCETLNKPLCIISPSAPLPSYLQRFIHIDGSVQDDAFHLTLARFVNEVRKAFSVTGKQRQPSPSSASSGPKTRRLRARTNPIEGLRGTASPREVQMAVHALLASKASFVESHADPLGRGVDLALWSEAHSSISPRPIFVEVKSGRLSQAAIAEAEEALYLAVRKGGAVAGLLLYLDDTGKRFQEPPSMLPGILRADIEDLAADLLKSSLATVLRRRGLVSANA